MQGACKSPGEYDQQREIRRNRIAKAAAAEKVTSGTLHVPTIRLGKPHHKQGVGLDTQRDEASAVEKRSPELKAALTQLKSTP